MLGFLSSLFNTTSQEEKEHINHVNELVNGIEKLTAADPQFQKLNKEQKAGYILANVYAKRNWSAIRKAKYLEFTRDQNGQFNARFPQAIDQLRNGFKKMDAHEELIQALFEAKHASKFGKLNL
jgi:hypothetical protein